MFCHTKIGPPRSGPPDQFLRKKWSPGPILAAKIGLPGLILAAKIGPPLPKTVPPLIMMHGPNLAPRNDFGSQNWSPLAKNVNSPPTDHDARTEFGKHDLLANNYTYS